MKKIITILSGRDWYDASVEHIVLLKDIDLEKEKQKRGKWYNNEYCPKLKAGKKPQHFTFTEWLIDKGLARKTTDDELEEFMD